MLGWAVQQGARHIAPRTQGLGGCWGWPAVRGKASLCSTCRHASGWRVELAARRRRVLRHKTGWLLGGAAVARRPPRAKLPGCCPLPRRAGST